MSDFITKILGQPAADLDSVERAFMARVHDIVSAAADNYDEAQLRVQEEELRTLFPQFFAYTVQWAAQELKAHGKNPAVCGDHDDAARLKAEARQVLKDLQNNLASFAVVYMHINRFMTLVRDEIKRDQARALDISGKKIKWTSDTGVMLSRFQRRKGELSALNIQYEKARALLNGVEDDWVALHGAIEQLCGPDDAENHERSLRAALRGGDIKRAQGVAATILAAKPRFAIGRGGADQSRQTLEQNLPRLIGFYTDHQTALIDAEGKVFLRAAEINLVLDSQKQEIRKINGYVMKYSMPYMEYKLDSLSHLRDRLMVIGSLENLMTLYRKMVTGLARPMPDLQSVREFEADVIGRVRYLQNTFFGEVPGIFAESAAVVDEFRTARKDYHDNMAHAAAEGADMDDSYGLGA